MSAVLSFLCLEDEIRDFDLVKDVVGRVFVGAAFVRVDTREAFLAALDGPGPSAILADYSLPRFSGLEALEWVRHRRPEIPFIFVTGTLGEELAVETLRRGAADYVLKHRLDLLGGVIRRELERAAERRALQEAQERVRSSEARYRSLLEQTQDLVWRIDPGGRITFVNSASREMLGYPPEALLNQPISMVLSQSTTPRVMRFLEGTARASNWESGVMETLLRRKDGSEFPAESRASAIFGPEGRIQEIQGITRDVTKRHRMETALRIAAAGTATYSGAEFFRSLAEHLTRALGARATLVGELDAAGRKVHSLALWADGETTEAAEFALELTPFGETPGVSFRWMSSGAAASYPADPFLQRFPGEGYAGTFLLNAAKGRIGLLSVVWEKPPAEEESARAILEIFAARAGAELERMHAVSELRASEEQHRQLFENSPVGIYRTAPSGDLLAANRALVRMLGYSSYAELARWSSQRGGFRPGYLEGKLRDLLETEGEIRGLESTWVSRDGHLLHLHENARVVRDQENSILYYEGTIEDVTQFKRAQEELARSQHELERAQSIGHVGSWVSQISSPMRLTWSTETCRIFGVNPAEFDGRLEAFLKRVHPEDLPTVQGAQRAALAGERRYEIEHRIVRPDGSIRWVRQQGDVERDARGLPARMLGVIQDVTESRLLEQQLRQAQKMETIGQLAAGVAHDLNNILTVIQGTTALLLTELAGQSEFVEWLNELKASAERAANLTRQLLLFGRKQTPKLQPLDLNHLCRNSSRMLPHLLGEEIQIQFDFAEPLPSVNGDAGMLEQVLLNLVVNARDAMTRGGRLRIRTSHLELDAAGAEACGASPGAYVCLAVKDSGSGIPLEIRDRIFEPFFTTKGAGKGTGLGLAMVYSIVKQHGGWIAFDSAPEQGTEFRICLPALTAAPVVQKSDTAFLALQHGSGETVLVVEDEVAVRALVARALSRNGYRVVQAGSGPEVLQFPPEQLAAVSLLLTDMVMPGGMSGSELALELRRRYPPLRVIICSGYQPDQALGPGLEGVRFLQKPFGVRELLLSVQASLSQPVPAPPHAG